jgi:hypothetical protein
MKRFILIASFIALFAVGGIAVAFTPSQDADLAAAGYTKIKSYRYQKVISGCTITVTESYTKYDIKSEGNYQTRIWPVNANHLMSAVSLVEDICITP